MLTYFLVLNGTNDGIRNQLTQETKEFNIELLYPGDYKLGELDLILIL